MGSLILAIIYIVTSISVTVGVIAEKKNNDGTFTPSMFLMGLGVIMIIVPFVLSLVVIVEYLGRGF